MEKFADKTERVTSEKVVEKVVKTKDKLPAVKTLKQFKIDNEVDLNKRKFQSNLNVQSISRLIESSNADLETPETKKNAKTTLDSSDCATKL